MALPNVYTSYATVLVEPQSVDEDLVRAGVASTDLNERLHLMTAQILSRGRLSGAIDEFGLYEDESEYMLRQEVIDLMRDRIRVEPVIPDLVKAGRRNADVEINEFKILFDDYDATTARDVAQKLANDFIETHIEERVRVSQKSLDFVDSELERLAERIGNVESAIAQVKNDHPGKRPEDMVTNQRRMERLMTDLAVAQRTFNTAVSDVEFYRSQLRASPTTGDDASPVRRLELLRLQMADFESRNFTDKHPDVVKARREIVALETQIEALGVAAEESTGTSVIQQQLQAEVRRAELRAGAAQAEVERIQAAAIEIERLIVDTPAVAEKIDALTREYDHLRLSYQEFSNKQLEANVQAQLERRQLGEQFRVLESAFIAPEPSAPNRILIIALGAVLGIGLGCGIGVLLESIDSSPHDARSLQVQLQLPVLAAIPEIWLESDRLVQRRQRLRSSLATLAVIAFAGVGGAANYVWVNGLPGFLVGGSAAEQEQQREQAGGAGG